MDLPYPWSAYARVQSDLDASSVIDDRAWGLEAGLAELLASLETPSESATVRRAIDAESRRERHRARLRRIHFAGWENVGGEPESVLDARRRQRSVRARISGPDWALLYAIGEGHDYRELASELGVTPGRLRVRVLRLRRAA
jgi:hypothetical protein